MNQEELQSMFDRLIQEGSRIVEKKEPDIILSFDTYCTLLGVEQNQENYDKWNKNASLEAYENRTNEAHQHQSQQ